MMERWKDGVYAKRQTQNAQHQTPNAKI